MNTLSPDGVAVVSENSLPDTFVAHVQASSDAGDVSCSLDSPDFVLVQLYDGEYKIVTEWVFDREMKETYNLVITCQDNSQPPLTTSKSLQVVIVDENDNAPVFLKSTYFALVPENAPVGTPLLHVQAIDPDEMENGEISYGIHEQAKSYFDIDKATGLIKTKVTFDRETMQQYEFAVIAVDQGAVPLSATASVHVFIEDINDEKPRFTQDSYAFGVTTDVEIGSEVGQVWAADADAEPFNYIQYSISNDESGKFNIDAVTGIITISAELDPQETTNTYEFDVTASGQEEWESDTAQVTVYVMKKENDEKKRKLLKMSHD